MKKRIALIVTLITIASSQIASAETGVVTAGELRVRQNSSLSSNIAGHLSKDTKIEILGKDGDFYKIAYKGKTGYVHKSYINIVKSASLSRGATSVQAPSAAKSGEITASRLNVRSGAGSTYAVTGVISRGSKVTIDGSLNGFYKINYKGKVSYISASFVKVTGEKTADTTITAIANSTSSTPQSESTGIGTVTASDFLSVRRTATISNNIMGAIYHNNKVHIYGTEGEFYKIKYANKWGFVHKSYLRVVKDSVVKAKNISTKPVLKAENISTNTVLKAEFLSTEPVQKNDTAINADNIVSYSSTFMGTPYLWGGATPAQFDATGKYVSGGFDCSGLVQYVYRHFGIELPRTTMDQIGKGTSVEINNLQKGDLVYFRTNTAQPSQVSHVGIYTGNNKFMHAPKTGDVIKISELSGYYKNNFVIGKRLIK